MPIDHEQRRSLPHPLDAEEVRLLAEAEAAIEAGLGHLRSVAEWLAYIHQRKLYRGTHPTFESYVEGRWGISRQRAYQLLSWAVSVNRGIQSLSERASREVAHLDAPTQQAVVTRVLASGKKPTAAALRAAVASVEAAPAPPPLPPPPEPRSSNGAANPPAPGASTHDRRTPTTERVRLAIADGTLDGLIRRVRDINREITALAQEPISMMLDLPGIQSRLREVARLLGIAKPAYPCCYCQERGCARCANQGWLTAGGWEMAPEELRR